MDKGMNIFVLSEDITECAHMHCDKHVVKMILESAQLLSTAVLFYKQAEGLYASTHLNHPCSIWSRENSSNFYWLYNLANELCKEYTFRYRKIHNSLRVINECLKHIDVLPKGNLTKFALAMPEEYRSDNAVQSYRDYYIGEKSDILCYSCRGIPSWITEKGLGIQKYKLHV